MFKKKGNKVLVYDTTKKCISGAAHSDTIHLIPTKLVGSFEINVGLLAEKHTIGLVYWLKKHTVGLLKFSKAHLNAFLGQLIV